MRSLPLYSPVFILVPLALSSLVQGCGGGSDVDMGRKASGGSGGTGSGGTIATGGSGGDVQLGGTGGSGGTSSGGSSGAMGDTCGGMPCADYEGTQDFMGDGVPSDAPDSFGGGTEQEPGTDVMREPAI